MPKLIDADEFKRVAAGCVFETPKGIRIKAEIAIETDAVEGSRFFKVTRAE